VREGSERRCGILLSWLPQWRTQSELHRHPRAVGRRFPKLANSGGIRRSAGVAEEERHKLYAELYDDKAPELVVSLEHVEKVAGIHDVLELNRHAARIRHAIADDPSQAIGSAKELLETVLKTVIGDHGQQSRDDIPELLKKARAKLDFDPKSAGGADTLRRTLSSLGQVVQGVAELRSLYGTGHGRSKSPELEVAHARLVVNAAVTMATFLLEIWQEGNRG
jgi:Abortive infection C-terminus